MSIRSLGGAIHRSIPGIGGLETPRVLAVKVMVHTVDGRIVFTASNVIQERQVMKRCHVGILQEEFVDVGLQRKSGGNQ
jgi:hypothetical protein